MQTPSKESQKAEARKPKAEVRDQRPEVRDQKAEWAAPVEWERRSVFGNYRAEDTAQPEDAPQSADTTPTDTAPAAPGSLQSAIDTAMARSFVYRFLASAFQDPEEENWLSLKSPAYQEALASVFRHLSAGGPALREAACAFALTQQATAFEEFQMECLAAFGHAARGSCPLNEIDYGDLKADPLFQPHRLADLAAFYRAFGLELAEDAGERHDHLCLELEFMAVLAAKEAYALEHQFDEDVLLQCRTAQKQFLREHLGRWTPAFARRLAQQTGPGTLRALADFLRVFLAADCARWQVRPGSEDLLLRPVDAAAERMCDSCGLSPVAAGVMDAPFEA